MLYSNNCKYKNIITFIIDDVMVIVVGNGHGDTSSNPDCISHSTNTLGKGMNPIILLPVMGK